jgi:hypothetical protein
MIDILYERIKVIYVDMMTQYPQDTQTRFKSILNRRFNLRELRGVGVKYMNSVARTTKHQLINMFWQYFSTRIHLPENEARRLPVVPDPIPEFARDLEHQQDDDDDENITWYIDRTPSRVNIPEDGYRTPTSVAAIPREPPTPRRRVDTGNYLRLLSNQQDPVSLRELRDLLIADYELSNTHGDPNNIYVDRYNIFITRRLIAIVNESLATGRQIVVPPMPLNLDERFSPMHLNLDEAFSRTVRKFNIIPTLLVQENENLEAVEDCPICYESVKLLDIAEIGCGHKFCGECVTKTLQKHNKRDEPCCAMCRGKIETCIVKKQEVYDQIVEYCNL